MKVARISWGFLTLLAVSPFLGRPTFSLRLASSLDFSCSGAAVSVVSCLEDAFAGAAFGITAYHLELLAVPLVLRLVQQLFP